MNQKLGFSVIGGNLRKLVVPPKLNSVAFRVSDVENRETILIFQRLQSQSLILQVLMYHAHALDMKDNLLSSAVRLPRFVKAEFTLPGVEAEKTVSRKRLFFIGLQSEDIPIIRDSAPHVFDKEYDASKIHAVSPE